MHTKIHTHKKSKTQKSRKKGGRKAKRGVGGEAEQKIETEKGTRGKNRRR